MFGTKDGDKQVVTSGHFTGLWHESQVRLNVFRERQEPMEEPMEEEKGSRACFFSRTLFSWILSDPGLGPVDGVKGAKQEDVNRERNSSSRNLMPLQLSL